MSDITVSEKLIVHPFGSDAVAAFAERAENAAASAEAARDTSIFAVSSPPAGFLRLKSFTMTGGDFAASYYISDFFRDDVSGGRFQFILRRASDSAQVAGIALGGTHIVPTGFTGLKFFDLVPLGGSGLAGRIGVDFGDGTPRWSVTGATNSTARISNDTVFLDDPLFRSTVDVVAAASAAEVVALSGFFRPATTDAYARRLIRGGVIGGGDPDDTYWLNYETIYYPGIPQYQIKFRLHSARYGAEVARVAINSPTDPAGALPPSLYLTMMSDGGRPFGADAGITAMIDIDWAAVEWTHVLTSYVTAAATGIVPTIVRSAEQTRAAWLGAEIAWHRRLTVGAATGEYPTVAAAIAAVTNPDAAAVVARNTYPSSHMCCPERPLLIEIVDADHLEEAVAYQHLGVDQSYIRLPHGCILRLRHDSTLYMDAPGFTAPVVEMNFTSRIEGAGLIEQRGSGYVLHIDNNNSISRAAPDAPEVLRRRIETILAGGLRLHRIPDDSVPVIGCGISNGQYLLLDSVRLTRAANTSGTDYLYVHNSPLETHGGTIHLRHVTSDAADVSGVALLALGKSHASEIRHSVIIEDSEALRVEVSNSAGGSAGFIRRGLLSGAAITGDMEP